jgi:hypothetical protein
MGCDNSIDIMVFCSVSTFPPYYTVSHTRITQEHTLVFMSRVLRRISGTKHEKVTGRMRNFKSSTFHWILKDEGMAWSCGMDRKQEKCRMHAF